MPTLVPAGRLRQYVTLQPMKQTTTDGEPTIDVDGDRSPISAYAAIVPATAQNLSRTVAGTTESVATHLVTVPYIPNLTTLTRVSFEGKALSVISVQNPDGAQRQLVLVCTEIVE